MLVKLKETGQYNKNYFKLFVDFQSRIFNKDLSSDKPLLHD